MELRPQEYKDFSLFLLAKERFHSITAVIDVALEIINSFRELHVRGFSYQDLNDGIFFVNPDNGKVLICDNDNVAPYGENLGIGGKCRYMAPEVVMGKKYPDINTDRFSLAVVLYLLFVMGHPLEGKRTMCPCLTEDLEKRFYGSEPIFVLDKNNDRNRPVRGVHKNGIKFWPIYPEFIQNEFLTAFSKEALVGDDIDKDNNICMNCGNALPKYNILKLNKNNIVLAPEQKLYACHVAQDSKDFLEVKGEIIKSGGNQSVLGLRNLSQEKWEQLMQQLKKSYLNLRLYLKQMPTHRLK